MSIVRSPSTAAVAAAAATLIGAVALSVATGVVLALTSTHLALVAEVRPVSTERETALALGWVLTPVVGLFEKGRFTVDLDADAVTWPAGVTVSLRRRGDGGGIAKFADACASWALRARCTKAEEGRRIAVGPNEAVLARARARQKHPDWVAHCRATRRMSSGRSPTSCDARTEDAEPGYAVG